MLCKHLNKILKYLKRALNRIYMTVKTKSRQSFEASDFMQPKALDIFVVAFNDAKLIECQYHFMQKNLRSSEYHYIICDNSNKTDAARHQHTVSLFHSVICRETVSKFAPTRTIFLPEC